MAMPPAEGCCCDYARYLPVYMVGECIGKGLGGDERREDFCHEMFRRLKENDDASGRLSRDVVDALGGWTAVDTLDWSESQARPGH